ncbi:copper amine oxidase N-terminal domain-containing protein [Cohnella hashimotonis]|uniref:Copper amine oxidase N-terminal domain-containing protein n=1 Tax=Cohnella hashimotonis TaxID=2826895 RepID=A0ABT6TKS4_9BACL|nr:copper amine oxidase N-terminal domain-containing protein [Cohnella hashimotonis]MDI4647430.1 copper amine oxidase N-terminal domain-containing protein [Cohnella hashimotonis]
MGNWTSLMAAAALLLSMPVMPGAVAAAGIPALTAGAIPVAAKAAQTPVKVIVTVGEAASVEIPAKIRQGRTLVPFRPFFSALGGQVKWEDDTNVATATIDGNTAAITAGASKFVFNGEEYLLSQPASMSAGTLYVPLGSVSLPLGARIAAGGSPFTVRVDYERVEEETEEWPDKRLAQLMDAVFERQAELMDGLGAMSLSGSVENRRVLLQIRSYGEVERKLGDAELTAVRAAIYRIAGEAFPLEIDVAECCTRDPDIQGVVEKVDTASKTIQVSGAFRGIAREYPLTISLFEDAKLLIEGSEVERVFTERMVGKTIRAWVTGMWTSSYTAVKVELK